MGTLNIFASPIDYSRVSDEALQRSVVFNSVLCVLIAAIGLYGFIKYVKTYEAGPAKFRPWTVFILISVFILVLLCFAFKEIF